MEQAHDWKLENIVRKAEAILDIHGVIVFLEKVAVGHRIHHCLEHLQIARGARRASGSVEDLLACAIRNCKRCIIALGRVRHAGQTGRALKFELEAHPLEPEI